MTGNNRGSCFEFRGPVCRLWYQFLPPATKLRQGNIFTGVCHSVHMGGEVNLCTSIHHRYHDQGVPVQGVSVPACITGHMTGGLSGGLCPGGEGSLSRGVSMQGGLCQGGLCLGGISVRETLPTLYGNERAVSILLECRHHLPLLPSANEVVVG